MKKYLDITRDYLLLPIKKEEPTQIVSVSLGEEKIYEYDVPVKAEDGAYHYDFQMAFPVHSWKGKTLTVEGDVPEAFMEAIVLSDQLPVGGGKRPMLHFAPETGWLNDPNGLVYHDGLYQLFFQHNPANTIWGNMTWGHAVSKDLLHWEQKEEALFPDKDGVMYSGCGMLNERGLLGLPKDAELYFYTCAGNRSAWNKDKKFVQKVAWSTDNGKTLHKMDGCILDHIVADNRDPNVYWYEGRQLYFMVLYLEKDEYAIFNSPDLQNWEMTQKLSLPDAWECPDLMEVPVEGGGTKWVFWTADGYYFVGDFDGSHYESDEIRKEAYHCMLPYAAQSYYGTDRVIMIPWMRTNNDGKVFRGMMGMPRQLTLVEKDGALILRQKLVDEYENAKEKMLEAVLNGSGQNGNGQNRNGQNGNGQNSDDKKSVTYTQTEEAAVEVVLYPEAEGNCSVNLYGTQIILEGTTLKLSGIAARSNGVWEAVQLGEKETLTGEKNEGRIQELKERPKKISLLSDGEILEITVDDGIVCEAFETCVDEKTGSISVEAQGTVKVEIYQTK